MEIGDLILIYDVLYAMGEILTTTWPGRLIFGMMVGSVIAWIARA